MLFKTLSAAVFGIDAYVVDVEVDLTPRAGDSLMPAFTMVGLPDAAVRESRERIRAAINYWATKKTSQAQRPTCALRESKTLARYLN